MLEWCMNNELGQNVEAVSWACKQLHSAEHCYGGKMRTMRRYDMNDLWWDRNQKGREDTRYLFDDLKKLNSVAWVHERTIPTERPQFVGEVNAKFADGECHMVRMTDHYGRNLCFLDRSLYFFFQVAPQLYSRGWVDPVADPLLLRKSGNAGNRTQTSGSVARDSDHQTTEAVYFLLHNVYKFSLYVTGNTIPLRSISNNSVH
jgi:hypothetical protein